MEAPGEGDGIAGAPGIRGAGGSARPPERVAETLQRRGREGSGGAAGCRRPQTVPNNFELSLSILLEYFYFLKN